MRLNNPIREPELGLLLVVAAWHVAALAHGLIEDAPTAPLWALRADGLLLLVGGGYCCWRRWRIVGRLEWGEPAVVSALAGTVLLVLGVLPLGPAVVWTLFSLAAILSVLVAGFFLTFKLDRLW